MKKIIIPLLIIIILSLVLNLHLDKVISKDSTSITLNSNNENILPENINDMLVFNTNINDDIWYQNIEVNIFSDDALLYPGKTGEYKFEIKNEMEYTVKFSISIYENENNIKIPLVYKLKEGNNLVNNDWDENLNEYNLTLESLEKKEYVLFWSWPFESNNELDTKLGQSDNLIHKINFAIKAESTNEKKD